MPQATKRRVVAGATAKSSSIETQRHRMLMEKQWWRELKRLSDNDDVAGFFARYADYLEWNKIESKSRRVIHKMARRASEIAARNV